MTHNRLRLAALATMAGLALAASACGKKDDDKKKAAPPPSKNVPDTKTPAAKTPPPSSGEVELPAEAIAEANKIFKATCSQCHGESGKGDGPGAAALNPKPRNYTDKAWQKSVTDDQLKAIIVKGGIGVGKSPTMTASPRLGKPENAAVLDALVQKIRSFAK